MVFFFDSSIGGGEFRTVARGMSCCSQASQMYNETTQDCCGSGGVYDKGMAYLCFYQSNVIINIVHIMPGNSLYELEGLWIIKRDLVLTIGKLNKYPIYKVEPDIKFRNLNNLPNVRIFLAIYPHFENNIPPQGWGNLMFIVLFLAF